MLEGAYVVIDWAGTAVSMYGASAGTFEALVDDEAVQPSADPTDSTLLFSKDDLSYGLHTAILRVTGGEVSITGAELFLAVGEAGYVIASLTIPSKCHLCTDSAQDIARSAQYLCGGH